MGTMYAQMVGLSQLKVMDKLSASGQELESPEIYHVTNVLMIQVKVPCGVL